MNFLYDLLEGDCLELMTEIQDKSKMQHILISLAREF